MAEWTQERIAQRMNCVRDAGDIFCVDDRAEALAILALAARGLAAEQDAVKARALVGAMEYDHAYFVEADEVGDVDARHGIRRCCSLCGMCPPVHGPDCPVAAFLGCPASTKETAT